jgi:hypothetical protein
MSYKNMRPLMPASVNPSSDVELEKLAVELGVPIAQVRKWEEMETACPYWINDLYQVQLRPCESPFVQINIRRRDGAAIFRDYRHFQQIKNQIVGPECEAVELYPAESRLVDASNKYHLWAVPDPDFRFPFGFQQRDVSDAVKDAPPGRRQRKL